MSTHAAAELFSALGQHLGIPALALDPSGCCRLVFDGSRLVEMRLAPQRLLLCANVTGTLGTEQARLLLQANAWGAGSAGGWFALSEQGSPCLHFALALEGVTAPQLLNQLELLLNTVETWEQRLQQTTHHQPWQRIAEFSQRI